ncbi:hypothetical protein JRQ81_016390 [Phrynocephalus forsythii]|uniref:Uncharacterized protein n=1 Tax=Phrynocephalus forsythii TaxID=171643 RepID=A0A9Q1B129_9SAUR|nr:hypothetical protein JRQ81_016390 [Phrynocephalus forsythii]
MDFVTKNMEKVQHKQKVMLRPLKGNKLQLTWVGPFTIVSKMTKVNYIIQDPDDGGTWLVYVNVLQPHFKNGEARSVLYAKKEVKDEGPDLVPWERRKTEEYNPEAVQYSPTLTESQKRAM